MNKPAIATIALIPTNKDETKGEIKFLSFQDPNEGNPKKAKIRARPNQFMTWNVLNYFDKYPDNITVTLVFPWSDSDPVRPFKDDKYRIKKVNDYSDDDGPGEKGIRIKVRKDAAPSEPGNGYKYTIKTDHDGIYDLDPELEVEDDTIVKKP